MNSETNDFSISTLIYLDIFFKNPIFLVYAQFKIHFKPAKLIPIFDVQNI